HLVGRVSQASTAWICAKEQRRVRGLRRGDYGCRRRWSRCGTCARPAGPTTRTVNGRNQPLRTTPDHRSGSRTTPTRPIRRRSTDCRYLALTFLYFVLDEPKEAA